MVAGAQPSCWAPATGAPSVGVANLGTIVSNTGFGSWFNFDLMYLKDGTVEYQPSLVGFEWVPLGTVGCQRDGRSHEATGSPWAKRGARPRGLTF